MVLRNSRSDLFLIGWQFSQADMILTSIWCERVLLSGSFIGLNQSYSQHLFTDYWAVLCRDLRFTGPVESTIQVNSSGAIGYNEYAENLRIPDVFSFLCSFMGQRMRRGDPKKWLQPD